MKEVARSLGVSTMTLYRRLGKAGLKIEALRDENGVLTAEGVATIGQLFAETSVPQTEATESVTSSQQVSQQVTQPAEVELAVLRVRLETATETIERLTEERDKLREENSRLLTLLEGEQMQRQQLLTDGGRRHGGLLAWLRRSRG
mgnify:CR=1 FL=1